MKKAIVTIIILALSINILFSQRWEIIYGEPGTDESFTHMINTYDKGFLLSTYQEIPQANRIIKTDINGNFLWDKQLLWNNAFIYSGHIDQNNKGEMIIAGGIHYEGLYLYWPMMVKLDSCGNREWCRVFPQPDYDYGIYNDVLALENGDFIAIGYFTGPVGYPDELYMDYVSADGDLVWRKAYASKADYPLIHAADGEGLFEHDDDYYIYGSCYWPYPDNPSHVFLRPMMVKIDSMFNEEWMIPFGVSDSLHGLARDMINLNDTLFVAAGYAYDGNLIVPLLAYFDQNGNEIGFTKLSNDSLGTGFTDAGIDVIEKINDSLFIVLADWGNQNEWYGGKFITDTMGNISNIMQNTYEAGRKEILRTGENEYVVGTGLIEGRIDWDVLLYKMDRDFNSLPYDTGSYTYDSLCPYQITSDTIDLSDCMIVVNTEEVPTPEQYYASLDLIPIIAAPNPATDKVVFSLKNTKHHNNMQLICFDAFGRKIHEQKIYPRQLESHVDVSTWKSGMYVAVVKSDGKVVGKEKVVVW